MDSPFETRIEFDYSNRLKNNLKERCNLTSSLCSDNFIQTFYMKWELILFCKVHNLKQSGTKKDITKRIYSFLEDSKKLEKI